MFVLLVGLFLWLCLRLLVYLEYTGSLTTLAMVCSDTLRPHFVMEISWG